jgi:hypothetical protein
MDIELIILVVGAIAVAIAFYAIKEDRQDKEIKRLLITLSIRTMMVGFWKELF